MVPSQIHFCCTTVGTPQNISFTLLSRKRFKRVIVVGIAKCVREQALKYTVNVFDVFIYFYIGLFCFIHLCIVFYAAPEAYGDFQARGRVRAAAETSITATATSDPSHTCELRRN